MAWRLHYTSHLASLLAEQDASEATAAKYAAAWHEFLDFVAPGTDLAGVLDAADAYRRDMRRRGLAQNTIRGRLAAIKSYFRWCHSRKLIAENPLVYFHLPRVEKNPRDVITEEELEPVLKNMQDYERNVRLVIGLGLYAGLRAGEIRRLHTRDVDLKHGVIRVKDGKGHKGAELLEPELPAPSPPCPACGYGSSSYFLIGQRTGGMIARNYAWRIVDRFLNAGPHRLRTTKATFSLEQGVKVEALALELGHEDINTTAGYTGRRNTRAKEAIKAVSFKAVS